jgi:hypothetical protein
VGHACAEGESSRVARVPLTARHPPPPDRPCPSQREDREIVPAGPWVARPPLTLDEIAWRTLATRPIVIIARPIPPRILPTSAPDPFNPSDGGRGF